MGNAAVVKELLEASTDVDAAREVGFLKIFLIHMY